MFDYLIFLIITILAIAIVKQAITIVPPNMAYVIERLGKYYATIGTGRYLLFPFVNNIAYRHSLEELSVIVPSHTAITRDNISLLIDSELSLKIIDPFKTSYCVDDYACAVTNLSQAITHDEFGKFDLDMSFEMREDVNTNIIPAINEASVHWGVQITSYEIKNIIKEE